MTEEQKISSGPETESLAEIDGLLNELDPEFNSTLSKINSEVAQITDMASLESIALSAEYLKEGSENKADEVGTPPVVAEDRKPIEKPIEIPEGNTFFEIFGEFLLSSALLPLRLSAKIFTLMLTMKSTPPIAVLKNAPDILSPVFQDWVVLLQALFEKLKTFSPLAYFKVVIIIILLGVIRFTLKDMATRLSPDKIKDPFLKSWADVADFAYDIPVEDQGENIDDPLRHPEYTILIHKIVANLKPLNPHQTPMVTAELYLEASNQDAAIEIKDRELEVRDSLERVFEGTTFDELDTKGGKERLKIHIRSTLDQMLNKGHIKRVFFSSINMVP